MPELLNCCLFAATRKNWHVMSGSMTHATFKKAQLDHLIDMILEAHNDPDHACQRLADQYPADNVQDYINISQDELDSMELTKSASNDPVTLSNATKKHIL